MKFENIEAFNFKNAFRGLRNPLDSWDKSDSFIGHDWDYYDFVIGESDMKLAQRMIKGGSDERKFLRQIFVSTDIIAPRYWWSEFDTYKVGTTSNSCSTMHKLSSYPITLEMFDIDENNTELAYWQIVVDHLESLRKKYIETKDYKWFRLLKQELPESFLQKRTITFTYENVRNMIHARKNHRLNEWSKYFIDFAYSLPYSAELLFYEN